MTLISDLKNIGKRINGNVITIGLDYKTVEDTINKNDNINNLYIMSFNGKKKSKSKNRGRRGKTISIKKIRRIFKKKRIDYIICNIEDVNKFLRSFIRNSIYINKNKLYIYGNKDNIDIELLEKRYKRYTSKINITEYSKDILFEIDNEGVYNSWCKDIIYSICDLIYDSISVIGDILIG